MAKPHYNNRTYRRNRQIVLAGNPPCYVPYCPDPATTADHIIPASMGGGPELANLRPACRPHNSSRGNRIVTSYSASW